MRIRRWKLRNKEEADRSQTRVRSGDARGRRSPAFAGRSLLVVVLLLLLAEGWIERPDQALAEAALAGQPDTSVPAGQMVSDLVRLGGNVTIDGTVSDNVVVLYGDVTLHDTADVKGMLIVIGGQLHRDPGARTRDVVVHLSFDEPVLNGLLVGGGVVAGLWMLQLGLTLVCILVPILFVLAWPTRFVRFGEDVRRAPGRLLGAGFLGGVLLLGVAALLALTLIGLPLALLAVLLEGAAFLLGLTAAGLAIGSRLRGLDDRSPWAAAAGAGALAGGLNVPMLGLLLALGLVWVGLGLVIFSFRDWRRHRTALRG